jgi:acetoin utilization protein AcuC
MSRPRFFYSDAMLGYDMWPQHPLKPRRLRMTYDLLNSYGLFDSKEAKELNRTDESNGSTQQSEGLEYGLEYGLEVVAPQPADWEEVAETHSRDYLEILSALNRGEDGERLVRQARKYGFGGGDNPIFPNIYDVSLLYSGGSIDAAQAIIEGEGVLPYNGQYGRQVAFNISGGLHHAHYARAAGFCVLNDCALGIRRLQRKFARVAYVDIDVHHGDGVQELFYDDPSVLTISLHESGDYLFPGTGYTYEVGEGAGVGYSVNLPFAPYTTDDIWLEAWRASALPILKAYDPDAILLQLGTDTHEFDPLAHLCLTAQGWLEAVRDVQALGKPIVAVGGGGYNLTTVPRMWTLAVTTLAGIAVHDTVPETYADRDRIPTLTDHHTPQVNFRQSEIAHAFAQRSVREIKQGVLAQYF